MESLEHFLSPAFFINSDHPNIKKLAKEIVKDTKDKKQQAILLYYYIRDMFKYNPYNIHLHPTHSQASNIIQRNKKEGHCIDKAIVLCACARALEIPSRLHFANVRNHIGTEKLEEYLKTNLLVFHGYMEFYLDDKWVKATPAFNKELCDKLNVATLEFDGEHDSIFQEYDKTGGTFMTYEHDYGVFHDFPLDLFLKEIKTYYSHLFEENLS